MEAYYYTKELISASYTTGRKCDSQNQVMGPKGQGLLTIRLQSQGIKLNY